jgi:hypothetical protein
MIVDSNGSFHAESPHDEAKLAKLKGSQWRAGYEAAKKEAAAHYRAKFLRALGAEEKESDPPRTTPAQIDNYGKQVRNHYRQEAKNRWEEL